jgi:hypothetical protein
MCDLGFSRISSTLKLEAAGSAETMVTSYQSKQCLIRLQRVSHKVVEEFRRIREERPTGLCSGIFKTTLTYKEEQWMKEERLTDS